MFTRIARRIKIQHAQCNFTWTFILKESSVLLLLRVDFFLFLFFLFQNSSWENDEKKRKKENISHRVRSNFIIKEDARGIKDFLSVERKEKSKKINVRNTFHCVPVRNFMNLKNIYFFEGEERRARESHQEKFGECNFTVTAFFSNLLLGQRLHLTTLIKAFTSLRVPNFEVELNSHICFPKIQ